MTSAVAITPEISPSRAVLNNHEGTHFFSKNTANARIENEQKSSSGLKHCFNGYFQWHYLPGTNFERREFSTFLAQHELKAHAEVSL